MTPFEEHGKLCVKGKFLTDKNNETVSLKGISTHNIGIYPEYVNEKAFRQFAEEYKVSIMRFAMYSAFADDVAGYADSDAKHREELEDLIVKGADICRKLGIYCLVDWHILFDYDPNIYKEEAIIFFKNICAKLKDYDNVLYEICNEPNMNQETKEMCSWESIKSYAAEVIPVIRSIVPDSVIIVGTPKWSQLVNTAASDILPFENVMYTLHFYADSHRDSLRNELCEALKKDLPVMVTEFGVCNASGDGDLNREQTDIWINLLNENRISYIIWNLSNKAETSSLIASECKKTSDFTDDDLTPGGILMKELMIRA